MGALSFAWLLGIQSPALRVSVAEWPGPGGMHCGRPGEDPLPPHFKGNVLYVSFNIESKKEQHIRKRISKL